jgi:hypothetical protein
LIAASFASISANWKRTLTTECNLGAFAILARTGIRSRCVRLRPADLERFTSNRSTAIFFGEAHISCASALAIRMVAIEERGSESKSQPKQR